MNPIITPQDIYSYYRGVPPWPYGKCMQWVLSSKTVQAVAAATGAPVEPPPPAEDDDSESVLERSVLLGCPIRIDDSAEGLNHEFIEGVPIWIHRDKAPLTARF